MQGIFQSEMKNATHYSPTQRANIKFFIASCFVRVPTMNPLRRNVSIYINFHLLVIYGMTRGTKNTCRYDLSNFDVTNEIEENYVRTVRYKRETRRGNISRISDSMLTLEQIRLNWRFCRINWEYFLINRISNRFHILPIVFIVVYEFCSVKSLAYWYLSTTVLKIPSDVFRILIFFGNRYWKRTKSL